ncbi:hypothetical protein LJC60_01855 [Ruminococcaceae bacterium OttesenSCG-928-D13]|nr:hypothetical protein [Ruminococcaceae bacterium OttesenSCG-928-D13]
MEHATTDYLFILSLYTEPVSLSQLLFHLEPGGRAERTAWLRAKSDLKALEKKNLVVLSARDGAEFVRLTRLGREAADALATAMADELVQDWQVRSLQFSPPCGQTA